MTTAAPCRAEIDGVWITTTRGIVVMIPAVLVETELAAGRGTIDLGVGTLTRGQPAVEWLTVTEAATAHLDDVDGLTLVNAKNRVSQAATAGKFTATGVGGKRRIEPTSFKAWRLNERERNLARDREADDPETV